MAIELDHFIVPSRNRLESARMLAEILGVEWTGTFGGFVAVYVSDTLTIDFGERDDFDLHHYCFHVDDREFEAILSRIRRLGVPFRSSPHGEIDNKVNTDGGGKNLFWFDGDGHNWELLTVSYARRGG